MQKLGDFVLRTGLRAAPLGTSGSGRPNGQILRLGFGFVLSRLKLDTSRVKLGIELNIKHGETKEKLELGSDSPEEQENYANPATGACRAAS
jgi:hypothetical protein